MYSRLFFEAIIYISVAALFGVFTFQVWAFMKDRKNNEL